MGSDRLRDMSVGIYIFDKNEGDYRQIGALSTDEFLVPIDEIVDPDKVTLDELRLMEKENITLEFKMSFWNRLKFWWFCRRVFKR